MKKEVFKEVKNNDLKYKFENLILKTLGDKIELQNSEKYCSKFASENIQFYISDTVPSINGHDNGVTQITFVSDLSIAKKVKKKESKMLTMIYTK